MKPEDTRGCIDGLDRWFKMAMGIYPHIMRLLSESADAESLRDKIRLDDRLLKECMWVSAYARTAAGFMAYLNEDMAVFYDFAAMISRLFLPTPYVGKNAVPTCHEFDTAINKAMLFNRAVKSRLEAQLSAEGDKRTTPEASSGQRKRARTADVRERNKRIAAAVTKLTGTLGRPPTVPEVVEETKLVRQKIYDSPTYQAGNRIATQSAKRTTEAIPSATGSEQYSQNSPQASRANRKHAADQADVDALLDEQKADQLPGEMDKIE